MVWVENYVIKCHDPWMDFTTFSVGIIYKNSKTKNVEVLGLDDFQSRNREAMARDLVA